MCSILLNVVKINNVLELFFFFFGNMSWNFKLK